MILSSYQVAYCLFFLEGFFCEGPLEFLEQNAEFAEHLGINYWPELLSVGQRLFKPVPSKPHDARCAHCAGSMGSCPAVNQNTPAFGKRPVNKGEDRAEGIGSQDAASKLKGVGPDVPERRVALVEQLRENFESVCD
jgi:hypothetical protein